MTGNSPISAAPKQYGEAANTGKDAEASSSKGSVEKREYDVVVVGAGPAGCAAALNMHKRGWRVIILERTPWRQVRGPVLNGIGEPNLPLMDALGIRDAVSEATVNEGRQFSLVSPRGKSLTSDWQPGGRRLFIQREPFDLALREMVDAAGIERIAEVRGVKPIRERRIIRGVKCRSENTGKLELRAKLVLACDGRNSKVAAAAGIGEGSYRFHNLYQGCIFSGVDLPDHTASVFPDKKRGRLLLAFTLDALGDGRAYVELETDLNRYRRAAGVSRQKTEQALLERFKSHPQLGVALKNATPEGEGCSITLQGHVSPKLQNRGVVLLGDAAACVDPLGSSGMTLALAGLVSLLKHLDGWDPKSGDPVPKLKEWETECKKRLKDHQRFIQIFRTLVRHPRWLDQGIKLLESDDIKRAMALETFNGLREPGEFLHLRDQLKFWGISK